MEAIVSKVLKKYFKMFIKNFKSDNFSMSLMKGEGTLVDLDLNEVIIQELLLIPPQFQIVNASCDSLSAKIPWTSFKKEPIVISLQTISLNLREPEEIQPFHSQLKKIKNKNKEKKRNEITENLQIEVKKLKLNIASLNGDGLMIEINDILIQSTNSNFQPGDLSQIKAVDKEHGVESLHKLITAKSITIKIQDIGGMSKTLLENMPLKVLYSSKRRIKDWIQISAKIEVLFKQLDLKWTLSEYHSLSDLINNFQATLARAIPASSPSSQQPFESYRKKLKSSLSFSSKKKDKSSSSSSITDSNGQQLSKSDLSSTSNLTPLNVTPISQSTAGAFSNTTTSPTTTTVSSPTTTTTTNNNNSNNNANGITAATNGSLTPPINVSSNGMNGGGSGGVSDINDDSPPPPKHSDFSYEFHIERYQLELMDNFAQQDSGFRFKGEGLHFGFTSANTIYKPINRETNTPFYQLPIRETILSVLFNTLNIQEVASFSSGLIKTELCNTNIEQTKKYNKSITSISSDSMPARININSYSGQCLLKGNLMFRRPITNRSSNSTSPQTNEIDPLSNLQGPPLIGLESNISLNDLKLYGDRKVWKTLISYLMPPESDNESDLDSESGSINDYHNRTLDLDGHSDLNGNNNNSAIQKLSPTKNIVTITSPIDTANDIDNNNNNNNNNSNNNNDNSNSNKTTDENINNIINNNINENEKIEKDTSDKINNEENKKSVIEKSKKKINTFKRKLKLSNNWKSQIKIILKATNTQLTLPEERENVDESFRGLRLQINLQSFVMCNHSDWKTVPFLMDGIQLINMTTNNINNTTPIAPQDIISQFGLDHRFSFQMENVSLRVIDVDHDNTITTILEPATISLFTRISRSHDHLLANNKRIPKIDLSLISSDFNFKLTSQHSELLDFVANKYLSPKKLKNLLKSRISKEAKKRLKSLEQKKLDKTLTIKNRVEKTLQQYFWTSYISIQNGDFHLPLQHLLEPKEKHDNDVHEENNQQQQQQQQQDDDSFTNETISLDSPISSASNDQPPPPTQIIGGVIDKIIGGLAKTSIIPDEIINKNVNNSGDGSSGGGGDILSQIKVQSMGIILQNNDIGQTIVFKIGTFEAYGIDHPKLSTSTILRPLPIPDDELIPATNQDNTNLLITYKRRHQKDVAKQSVLIDKEIDDWVTDVWVKLQGTQVRVMKKRYPPGFKKPHKSKTFGKKIKMPDIKNFITKVVGLVERKRGKIKNIQKSIKKVNMNIKWGVELGNCEILLGEKSSKTLDPSYGGILNDFTIDPSYQPKGIIKITDTNRRVNAQAYKNIEEELIKKTTTLTQTVLAEQERDDYIKGLMDQIEKLKSEKKIMENDYTILEQKFINTKMELASLQ
ncbi:hypothetical protein ACTFIR_008168 [Dictyostelium discoideum]